jgi:multidrug efflux pump subunit AcrA (membrane-fusion protein)
MQVADIMHTDVKTAEINLIKEQNNLATVEADLNVLEKYTYEKESTDRKNKVAQAEKKLVRVQRENMSNLAQKQADFNAKEQSLALRKRQVENYKNQLEAATIKAPSDGLVVYGSSGGYGRRDTPIQAGATVRYQETLIRLPETSRMKAVARIQEAQVSKLRVDPIRPMRAVLKIAGQPNPMGGWVSNISVMADFCALRRARMIVSERWPAALSSPRRPSVPRSMIVCGLPASAGVMSGSRM